jgi:hypothetical protein
VSSGTWLLEEVHHEILQTATTRSGTCFAVQVNWAPGHHYSVENAEAGNQLQIWFKSDHGVFSATVKVLADEDTGRISTEFKLDGDSNSAPFEAIQSLSFWERAEILTAKLFLRPKLDVLPSSTLTSGGCCSRRYRICEVE